MADFIFTIEAGQHHAEVALRLPFGQSRDRIRDRSCREESDQHADQQHDRTSDLLIEDGTGDRILDGCPRLAEILLQFPPHLHDRRLHLADLRRDFISEEIADFVQLVEDGFQNSYYSPPART